MLNKVEEKTYDDKARNDIIEYCNIIAKNLNPRFDIGLSENRPDICFIFDNETHKTSHIALVNIIGAVHVLKDLFPAK